jgi:hypothetical protein
MQSIYLSISPFIPHKQCINSLTTFFCPKRTGSPHPAIKHTISFKKSFSFGENGENSEDGEDDEGSEDGEGNEVDGDGENANDLEENNIMEDEGGEEVIVKKITKWRKTVKKMTMIMKKIIK